MHTIILTAPELARPHHPGQVNCPKWESNHVHAMACNWDAAIAGMNKAGPLSWLILALMITAAVMFIHALGQRLARNP